MTSWDFPGGPVVKTPHFQSKLWFFPVVIYGCESRTIKKAEHQRIDAFKLWCWRILLRGPWTARKSNQSKLKEINPEYSLKGLKLMLKLKLPGLISPWRTKIPHASWYSQKKKKDLISFLFWNCGLNFYILILKYVEIILAHNFYLLKTSVYLEIDHLDKWIKVYICVCVCV